MSEWISPSEAAEIIGLSQRTIQNWVDSGRIPSRKTEDGKLLLSLQSLSEVDLLFTTQPTEKKPKLRVLVVEDDPVLRRLYELKFSMFSVPHDLFIAENGYRGLLMLGKSAPHVLISDLMMPKMNGFEMIREIQSMHEFDGMRIIAVTALGVREIMDQGGLPEKVTIQPKPISFDAIETILFQIASSKGLLTEESPKAQG